MVHNLPENFHISDFDVFHSALLHVSSLHWTGGWRLELPDGETKTFTGLFLSANWFMR